MNKVILLGNLTRAPETKKTQGGRVFARTSIAVKRPFGKDTTDFFNLVAWERSAEFLAKYFSKGSRILIEGHLQTGSYEKDDVKHSTVDVVVDQIEFAGDAKKSSSPADDFNGESTDTDDFPF